jgi:hypothetical protein
MLKSRLSPNPNLKPQASKHKPQTSNLKPQASNQNSLIGSLVFCNISESQNQTG